MLSAAEALRTESALRMLDACASGFAGGKAYEQCHKRLSASLADLRIS